MVVTNGVPEELLHAIVAQGLDTVEAFAAVESDESEARKFFKDDLGIDPQVAGYRGIIAKLITSWQAARTRVARRSAADAEAHLAGEVRTLSRGTKLELRRAWERAYARDLDDESTPAGPYLDLKTTEIENGD